MKPPDPVLEALWKRVLDDWEDDAPHAAFLEHCRNTEQLAEAAARYRGMKGDRERGARAEKRLAGVALLAMSELEAARRDRTDPSNGVRLGLRLVLMLLFLGGSCALLVYLLRT